MVEGWTRKRGLANEGAGLPAARLHKIRRRRGSGSAELDEEAAAVSSWATPGNAIVCFGGDGSSTQLQLGGVASEGRV